MKNDKFNRNDFDEIEECDDVIYDSDNENYDVEELTDDEVEETIGGELAKPEELTSASTPIATNRNFKYTTTEDEICLTDLTQRLGQIDKIQVINNPINAKISCNDNLVSIENQGAYGLVQMEVSGHNAGETKSARAENIFVEFDSDKEEEWTDAEDDYEDDTYYDELDDEELEEAAGRSYRVIIPNTKKKSTKSDHKTFTNSRGGKVVCVAINKGIKNVNVSHSYDGKRVTITKKNRRWRGKAKVQVTVKPNSKTYIYYKYEVDFF